MDLSFNVNLHNQTRHLLHRRYLARKKTNLNMNLNREIDRGITEYQKIPTFKTPTPELPKNLLTQKPNRAPISQKPHTQNSALQTKPAKATQPKTSPPKKKPIHIPITPIRSLQRSTSLYRTTSGQFRANHSLLRGFLRRLGSWNEDVIFLCRLKIF